MQDDVTTLEIGISEARKDVALRDALLRLQTNKDFKDVINERYLKEEAIRLTHCLGSPNMEMKQEIIVDSLQAISMFKQFLHFVIMLGNQAEQKILDSEEQLDYLNSEEGLAEQMQMGTVFDEYDDEDDM